LAEKTLKGEMMKNLRIFIVCLTVIFFATGCHCSKRAKEKKVQEKTSEAVSPSVVSHGSESTTPTPTPSSGVSGTSVSPSKPADSGKATPYETQQATKGEELPLQPIPDKAFKSPSDISPELALIFTNIHFDFDKYDIRPVDVPTLTKIAKYLLENPDVEVLIEGHCDERGTREYNLVLGEQRALSTRRFLVELGVSPKRLYTVSFGEDMPIDPRHNEEAWAKNRRAEFKIAE